MPTSRPSNGHESADVLVAFASGLLSGEAEGRVVAHLESCADCRESFESLTAREDWESPPGEHVPAAMLARWPNTQAELRGVERELIQKHLERCDSCRAELTTLGFEPTLAARPAGPAVVHPIAAVRDRTNPRRETRSHGWWRDVDWSRWALGGGSSIVGAAAAWMVLAGPFASQQPAQVAVIPSPTRTVVPRGAAAQLELLAALPEPMRGGSAPALPQTLTAKPGQRTLYLQPPLLFADRPTEQAVTLEVRTPSDSVLCSLHTTLGELGNCSALPLDAGDWPWVGGTYHLVAKLEPKRGVAGASETIAFSVRLAR